MSSNENETNTRSPADLGWDDAVLWTDADVAVFLRIDAADVDAAVANGIPCVYVARLRRYVPSEVRDHCARRSLSVILPAPPKKTKPTTWMRQRPIRRPSACSGRLVQA